jgi:hypothetical protein
MNIGSLSSAATTALNGLGHAIRQVEETAEHVAAGVADPNGASFSDGLSEIARLPLLKHQARANAVVFNTAQEMLEDLARMPRK